MEWFKWYPALYEADTEHLTAEQDGIYRRLIDRYMRTRQPLPDNENALARIAGVSLDSWCHASAIVKPFFKADQGKLFHSFCDKQLAEQDETTRTKSLIGKIGAEKRWNKSQQNQQQDSTSHSKGIVDPMQEERRREENNTNVLSKAALFNDFWDLYPRQRRGSKDKALFAYKAAIKRGNTEQQIIEGVKTYAASSDVTRGYAKGCAAWLNDDGFLNDHSVKVGVQGGSPARANRGFDALATAAVKISESLDRDDERLRRENPVLYFQKLANQSGGTNHIAGSLEAPDAAKPDAAPPGTSSDQEDRTNGHE